LGEIPEIEYNSLKKHPLWINKKGRENFLPMQIEKSSPAGKIPKNAFLQKDPKVKLFVNSSLTEGILIKTTNTFHLINKTSLIIWEMCDGTHSKIDVSDQLARHFPEIKSSALAKDSNRFIEDLHKNHFITYSF
jgi:hypothetical protein